MQKVRDTKSDILLVENILSFSTANINDKAIKIKEEYLTLSYDRLIALVNKAIEENPDEQFSKILDVLNSFSEKELDDFLFIPEVANKIYRRKDMTSFQKADYLLKIIDGVNAVKEKTFDTKKYAELWTANGSHLYQFDVEDNEFAEYEAPTIQSSIVMDFFSPYNRLISNEDCNASAEYVPGMYSYEDSEEITNCLDVCIKRVNPIVQQFIRDFVAVMMFKKFTGPDENRVLLFSATDGAFISRVIFGNVDEYCDEELIDAIVHESIHGLLFMIDELDSWMPKVDVSDEIGRIIVSPWTGNMLTLRNVLQAVFVWYGLYNFWRIHEDFSDSPFISNRLNKIRKGFENLDISVYGKEVPRKTVDAIANARQRVLNDTPLS